MIFKKLTILTVAVLSLSIVVEPVLALSIENARTITCICGFSADSNGQGPTGKALSKSKGELFTASTYGLDGSYGMAAQLSLLSTPGKRWVPVLAASTDGAAGATAAGGSGLYGAGVTGADGYGTIYHLAFSSSYNGENFQYQPWCFTSGWLT